MDWTQFEIDRFVKIMTMAMSAPSNESEIALRKASAMLNQAGGTFESLGDALRSGMSLIGGDYPRRPRRSDIGDHTPTNPAHRTAAEDAAAAAAGNPARDPTTNQLLERLARLEFRNRTLERDNEVTRSQLDEAVRYIIKLEDDLAQISGQVLRKNMPGEEPG